MRKHESDDDDDKENKNEDEFHHVLIVVVQLAMCNMLVAQPCLTSNVEQANKNVSLWIEVLGEGMNVSELFVANNLNNIK